MKDYIVDFSKLGEEDINIIAEREKESFTKMKDNLRMQMDEVTKKIGMRPERITNVKMSPLTKTLIVLKKIAKNAILSRITGIDPYSFDNDLSMLKNNSYESCMKSDLPTLAFSATQDLIDGIDKLNERLSGEQKRETVLAIDDFYKFSYEDCYEAYSQNKITDYCWAVIPILRELKIINDGSYNKFCAITDRGYNLNLTVDFYAEMEHAYEGYTNAIKMGN